MLHLILRNFRILLSIPLLLSATLTGGAHPLGNFTINHFARIECRANTVRIRYITDLAEIPAFQALQVADTDNSGSLSEAEAAGYLDRFLSESLAAISLTTDEQSLTLRIVNKKLTLPPGAAGLPTMRIECDLEAALPATDRSVRRLKFSDGSQRDRQGWHELFVVPADGASIFDSTAFGSAITDELKVYPEDLQLAPLNERTAEWSVAVGAVPAGAKPLLTRAGKPLVMQRDRFAELIAVQTITPGFALFALAFAFVLGGAHALSPGHGKTVVGAYLVGSKGTVKHAAFLGLTVTITHTIGVFALGLVTLFASRYVLPEKLYPILSLLSGLLVTGIGISLFTQRLRAAIRGQSHHHHHGNQDNSSEPSPEHHAHSHLPPGFDGEDSETVTWRNLLALGISGGLLPCPSALVVMLSAISLHRVGFGLLLIVAFSLGLASVLTGIGLAFVYAGKKLQSRQDSQGNMKIAMRVLPVLSALIISAIGSLIIYQSMQQAGVDFRALWQMEEPESALSLLSVLTLGIILGLKHAVEADHLAAVTAIVSERRSIFSSAIVGGLWGVGHTIPILLVGILVLALRIEIGERIGLSLEFCVGLMLIALGAHALWKLSRGETLHLHAHQHDGHAHIHPHFHQAADETAGTGSHKTHKHARPGMRPLFVGMMHGFAGSAALVPLVVSKITSPMLGMIYMLVFGIGSIGGMMLMSSLVGLPLHLTAERFSRFNYAMRALAGLFSVGFGLFMVYEIGFQGGLFQ